MGAALIKAQNVFVAQVWQWVTPALRRYESGSSLGGRTPTMHVGALTERETQKAPSEPLLGPANVQLRQLEWSGWHKEPGGRRST